LVTAAVGTSGTAPARVLNAKPPMAIPIATAAIVSARPRLNRGLVIE
jgi:hypothetical protein